MKNNNTGFWHLGSAAVMLVAIGCAELEVTNLNDPDRDRAISSAGDVEALISGGFQSWWSVSHYSYPGPALSTAADAHSSSWGNWGMRDSGWEPRRAYNNDAAYSSSGIAVVPWNDSYRALAAVRDGLLAIDGGLKIQEGDGPDNTVRAVAFGKLIQAFSLANLAVVFDKAFVVDETVEDVSTLELVDYNQVWMAAEKKFEEAIVTASGGGFSIPASWVGFNGEWDSEYFVEVARAFRARYRSQVARTEAERSSVDWGAVLQDATYGLSRSFAGYYEEGGNWAWHRSKLHTATYTGWARIDYRTIGPSDASGKWEEWANHGPDQKRPFHIDTDDRRITSGSPESDGKYIRHIGNSPFPADRGVYHYSHYIDWRWRSIYENNFVGEYPDMTAKELGFLAAEANYRMGNVDAAMMFVNESRANGDLPPFVNAAGVAPGGERCVPQNADGSCGNLWEAMKYEKRIELFHYGFGTEYFDDRGWGDLVTHTWEQLPVPGSELDILLMELYSFGGPGGQSAAPDFNDVSTNGLRRKAAMHQAVLETLLEKIDVSGGVSGETRR